MTSTATLGSLRDGLKLEVQNLVIIEPSADTQEVVNQGQLAAFKLKKAELTTAIAALPVDSPDNFALAGELISACDMIVSAIDERMAEPIASANKVHKSLTGARKDMAGDLEELARGLRGKRATFKAGEEAKARELGRQAEAAARAKAEAEQRETARIAAEEAAETARLAAEAAAEAAAATAAAAEIEDPDAAMEAAAAAAELEAQAAEQARQADLERQQAEAAAQAPVVVPRVAVAVPLAVEEGVTWADNWEARWPLTADGKPDTRKVLEAILAVLPSRPDLMMYVILDEKMVSKQAGIQKTTFRVPLVEAVNNKIERRSKQ